MVLFLCLKAPSVHGWILPMLASLGFLVRDFRDMLSVWS